MCKYKDTTLGIKKLDFNVKRGAMAVFLTDGREVIVPVKMFHEIKNMSKKQMNCSQKSTPRSPAMKQASVPRRTCS